MSKLIRNAPAFKQGIRWAQLCVPWSWTTIGIRDGCKRALTPYGFEVEIAENGSTGLRKLRQGDSTFFSPQPHLHLAPVMQRGADLPLTRGILCAIITFRWWDAAMTLGLEEDMSPTILRRHLTHEVFAKAMPSVWVSRVDRANWLFARAFFIYADKES
jgi:hypothetical protein